MSAQPWITFNRALSAGVILTVAWLIGWPLVMNAWAASHWTRVECRLGPLPQEYLYVVNDTVYVSRHRDFWEMGGRSDRGISSSIRTSDSTCWVNPNDPYEAVHFLDVPTDWSGSASRLVGATLLVIVAAGVHIADARRRRAVKETRP